MAEDKKETKKENNMKFAVIIIVVLAILLFGAVFALQQKKNNDDLVGAGIGSITGDSSGSTSEEQDAGAIGKNEIKLTNDNFKKEIEDYKGVALVDFYLSTCPHCQNVAKEVTAVADQLVGKVKVGKLESRTYSDTGDKFKIESVPTFIVFKDGKEVDRATGERKKDELLKLIEKYTK